MVNKKNTVSFISGRFNVLHAGHIRLFKFAKSISSKLVVGVLTEDIDLSEKNTGIDERVFALSTNKLVDEVMLVGQDINDTLFSIKPDIVIKGSEHKFSKNKEKIYTTATSSQLIFSSGASITAADLSSLGRKSSSQIASDWIVPDKFIERHGLKWETINNFFNTNNVSKVLVIGDSIVDKYIECTAVGMSQEEPVIVASPLQSKKFIGGAAIVAAHARSLGASVKFFTLLGDDVEGKYLTNVLTKLDVNLFSYSEVGRPTTTKTRFKIADRSVFRLNELLQNNCSEETQNIMFDDFLAESQDVDLVVVSDFNYGTLASGLIHRILKHSLKHEIPLVADSQSSSQFGDITRYKNTKLVTPTEYEARLSLNNKEDGLVQLAEKIRNQTNSEHVFLKLGKAGLIIHNPQTNLSKVNYSTDELPALFRHPVDTAGAGDSLFIASSLALSKGASIWEAALIGSVSAGIQVSRSGNIPVTLDEIRPVLMHMFHKKTPM